jgi:WD40 repeat protein
MCLWPLTKGARSADGNLIAIGGGTRRIQIQERDGPEVAVLTGHLGCPTAVAFSPDGRTLASGSDTGEVFPWCEESEQLLYPLCGHKGSVLDLAFSLDGTRLITAGASLSAKPWNHFWWELRVLVSIGKEQAIRGEVLIWPAPALRVRSAADVDNLHSAQSAKLAPG